MRLVVRRFMKQAPVEQAPASALLLNNSYDVGFYCSTGERSRAPALLNAALLVVLCICMLYVVPPLLVLMHMATSN